jgi:hypothetical protein
MNKCNAYTLKDIPSDLYKKFRRVAFEKDTTVKDLFFEVMRKEVESFEKEMTVDKNSLINNKKNTD